MSKQDAHTDPQRSPQPLARRARGVIDAASSMRVGFVLLGLIAAYAVVGMTPIGLLMPGGAAADWMRARTVAQLPAFEMTAMEWFATPLFRTLVAALVANMLLSTLLRVPRRWSSAGAWATHLGIIVLALGGAWHAAHKVEGELTLTRDGLVSIDDQADSLRTIFADDRRATLMVWIEGHGEIAIELPSGGWKGGTSALPRFNDAGVVWAGDGRATMRIPVYDAQGVRVTLTGFAADARVALIELADGTQQWLPLPTELLRERAEWRGGYRASAIGVEIELEDDQSLSTWVGFATGIDGAVSRTMTDGRRVVLLFTAAGLTIEGHAFRLRGFTVEPFTGTEVPRDFAVTVGVRAAERSEAERIIRLNQPLVLRDKSGGLLDRVLATRRYTLSVQGWDDEGWFADQRARFVVLKVSNAAGMPMIALGGWMVGIGVLWSVLLRPIWRTAIGWTRARRTNAPAITQPKHNRTRWRTTAIGLLIGFTTGGIIAWLISGPASVNTALGDRLTTQLASQRTRLVDDAGTPITLESWLARRGSFIGDLDRPQGVALAARLWLEPAALVDQPVVAVPRGALLDELLSRAGDQPIGEPYRAGHRLPIEFVMEHLGESLASGRVDEHATQDAELLLDRIETALALVDGPTFDESAAASGWRARLERTDDAATLLWLIAALGAAFVATAALGIKAPPGNCRATRVPLAAGTIAGLALVAYLIRGTLAQRLPMHNLHEALMLMGLLSALAGATLTARADATRRATVPACIGIAAIAAFIAAGVPTPGAMVEREAGILASADLLAWHVAIIIAGYAAVAINAALALLWLARPRTRASLTATMRRVTDTAFALLTIGIALGAWWAHSAWGRWWAFDPKETFSLVLWLSVLAGVHVRAAEPRRLGLWLTVCALAALLAMVWNFVGVNLLLPGLHSYAS